MTQFEGVAVSPGSLSTASFSVFAAVTFALLGFSISGTFGFEFELLSAFIFVFSSTLLLRWVQGAAT